jgi:hypothetical protein
VRTVWASGLALLVLACAEPADARVAFFPQLREQVLVDFAYYSGLALALLVVVLMGAIVAMRLVLVLRRFQEARFLEVWRPKLAKYVVGMPVALPKLKRHERTLMFGLWSQMHESVRGSGREHLNALAREVGLDGLAWKYVRSANPRKQLIGLIALGNLREGKAWFLLAEWLESGSPTHSIAAMRGLMLVDPRRAMPLVVPHIARRSDWSPVRVASILKEAGTDVIFRVMAKSALQAPAPEAIRLVKYLAATNAFEAVPIVRQLLAASRDPGVVSACLPMLREPQDLDFIRARCGHPVWFVRVQAAIALGRVGEPGDERHLQSLLADSNWWVRYRAAQALASLPFLGTGLLSELKDTHSDAYARDILSQVLAESPLA